jgi:hypothetical protein
MKDDSRGLLPSASAVPRYRACEGSYLLSLGVEGYRTKEMLEWAESGDRIHEAWAKGAYLLTCELAALTEDEREVYLGGVSQRKEAIKAAGMVEDEAHVECERRLWLVEGGKQVLSGKSDYVAIDQTRKVGLVIDYKTGRGEQDAIDESEQIRTLIVLNAQENGYIEEWYGGICQPLLADKIQLVKYTRADIEVARRQLLELVVRVNQPGAKTTAGIQCKFCPAVLKCESAKAMLQAFGLMEETTSDGQALSEYLVLAKAAKPIIKRIEEHAKGLLAKDAASVPGWQIGEGSKVKSITDTFKCFELVTANGLLTREIFMNEVIGVGLGDLQKAVQAYKKTTKKDAEEQVNAVCLPVIAFTPKAGSLEQI